MAPVGYALGQYEVLCRQGVQIGIPEIDKIQRVGHDDHVRTKLEAVMLDQVEDRS
jgi:hypothetical protein